MNTKRLPLRILLCSGFLAIAARGQSLGPSPIPVTDGVVNATVTQGSTTYFGGQFTMVAADTGSGLVFDKTTGALKAGWPKIDGPVNIVVSDGSGGFYIGGSFRRVGGVWRPLIAHILASGQLDAAFDAQAEPTYSVQYDSSQGQGVNIRESSVRALALDGSKLYIAGQFEVMGTTRRAGLACLDAAVGSVSSWNPGVEMRLVFPRRNCRKLRLHLWRC